MSEVIESAEQSQLPAIKIIKQIQEGAIDPEKMPKDMRQACVEYLLTQFMPISKIAAILRRDERTIKRDKKEIDIRNSQKPSVDYSLELLAELKRKSDATQEHLMALAKEDGASVQEKAQAAFYLWKSIQEQMKLLQSLGYLPDQPLKIEATITRDDGRDVAQLRTDLAEVKNIIIQQGKGDDSAINGLVKSIEQDIAIAEANNNMDQLQKLLAPMPQEKGNSDGSNF